MTERTQASGLIRINRYLSICGFASRRKADELVLAGRVRINGSVMTDLGTRVDPATDKITLDDQSVTLVHDHLYLVLNKPKDTITTLSDERGRKTVVQLVRTKQRVFPIGRLDRNTTGVLLLTSDGEFAHHLMHPRFEIPKSYRATCDKPVAQEHLRILRKGVVLEDGKRSSAAVVSAIPGSKGREIGIMIHEGRNRQVRRMFESFGYDVKKLDRVAYGPVTYEGLSRGKTRRLTHEELRKLRELSGVQVR